MRSKAGSITLYDNGNLICFRHCGGNVAEHRVDLTTGVMLSKVEIWS